MSDDAHFALGLAVLLCRLAGVLSLFAAHPVLAPFFRICILPFGLPIRFGDSGFVRVHCPDSGAVSFWLHRPWPLPSLASLPIVVHCSG